MKQSFCVYSPSELLSGYRFLHPDLDFKLSDDGLDVLFFYVLEFRWVPCSDWFSRKEFLSVLAYLDDVGFDEPFDSSEYEDDYNNWLVEYGYR